MRARLVLRQVKTAISCGYRPIDTAATYTNAVEAGEGRNSTPSAFQVRI